jgi:phage terminase large subunit-like protein
VAVSCYDRHQADCVIAEVNYGGAMVEAVVKAAAAEARMRVPFKEVTASRGKMVRAEPRLKDVGLHLVRAGRLGKDSVGVALEMGFGGRANTAGEGVADGRVAVAHDPHSLVAVRSCRYFVAFFFAAFAFLLL